MSIPQRLARCLAWILCGTLLPHPVWSQTAGPEAALPGRLQLRILSPVPMTEPAGALSANRIAVQVLDEWGRPVPRATVSFRLPEAGPGGAFLNGLHTEVVVADGEGRASVQGFDWREEAGSTFMHVIAAYGEIRAGAMVEIQLGRKPTAAHETEPGPSGPGHTHRSANKESNVPLATEPRTLGQGPGSHSEIGDSAPDQNRIGRVVPPAETPRTAVLAPAQQSPRETIPEAPDPNVAAVRRATEPRSSGRGVRSDPEDTEAGSNSFVTVKQNSSGGGSKALLFLVIAGAAAGGALAAGMASGGGSGSGNNPGTPTPPAITIGNPTITVSGGN